MKSTDFIKIPGLQSTPGAEADLQSWEVFEGRGGECGGGAEATVNVAPGNGAQTNGGGSKRDQIQALLGVVDMMDDKLKGSWLDKFIGWVWKERDLPEDVRTRMVREVPAVVEGASLTKIVYDVVVKCGDYAEDLALEVLKSTALEAVKHLTNDIVRNAEDLLGLDGAHIEKVELLNIKEIRDELRAFPLDLMNEKFDIMIEKLDKLANGSGNSDQNAELIQAIKDLKYNAAELHLPNSNMWVHLSGDMITRDGGDSEGA